MNQSLKAMSGEILSANTPLQTAALAHPVQKQLNRAAQIQVLRTGITQMRMQGKFRALNTAMMGAAQVYSLMNQIATMNPDAAPALNLLVESTIYSVKNDIDNM